jgi:predicted dehydrogenase
MESRRRFLQTSAVAAVVSKTVLGANDRIRMALIGTGGRGVLVQALFRKHPDCEFVAACDVRKSRLDDAVQKMGGKVDAYSDYRRVLERKDVDAVLVATPDHWHSRMTVDACAAGKDVYVEKPVSNMIEAGLRMVEAARKYNRVVQVGVQQRSGAHFQEAAKIVQEGALGQVTHALLLYGGSTTRQPDPVTTPPPDLDWEMFQGPAPRRPYRASREMNWRSYYDYGGGLVTDWGVHLTDVAHWYLNSNTKGPLLSSASAQYVNVQNPEQDQPPDAFICSWKYEKFVMSFTNAVVPNPEWALEGSYFYGPKGVLHIHRKGYRVLPQGGGRRAAETQAAPPLQAQTVPVKQDYQNDPDTTAHARNFLECVKSRQRPIADIEIGFNSTLPCLLALLAIQQGRSFTWDGKVAKPA